jgi:2-(1,2-epoxy-1,2-dihydrophenyl)acetyl-CoA isomerase
MSAVIVERKGATALLRLNSPANMNAISLALRSGLADELPGLLGDPQIRCLILTGTGEAFSAGGDIKQMQERGATEVRSRLSHAHKWCRLLLESEKPVIAAVNGAAVGAGFSLALLCDLILISDRGFFRAGFPAIGAAPDLGLAFTLPRITGMMRAKEILMTNRRIEPAEAVSLGLALRQVPQKKLLEEAQVLADQIAAGPGTSLGLTKTLLNRAYSTTFDQFLEVEAMAQAIAFGSAEFAEGVAAFLAKRRPDFSKA